MASAIEVKFAGPGRQEHDSLHDQATYFLNTYWPNWKCYDQDQSESYIIPSVFYEDPECNHKEYKQFRSGQQLLHNTLRVLAEDGIQAPFMAVHNAFFDVNSNSKFYSILTKMLPHLSLEKVQEIVSEFYPNDKPSRVQFDFIIIGPKTGIIIVDVTSTNFGEYTGVEMENRQLDDVIKRNLAQSESALKFVRLLQTLADDSSSIDTNRLCKINVYTNIEKNRFDAWVNSKRDAEQIAIKTRLAETVQWFKDNMVNLDEHVEKLPYYSALKRTFESRTPMSESYYRTYACVVATMKSINPLESSDYDRYWPHWDNKEKPKSYIIPSLLREAPAEKTRKETKEFRAAIGVVYDILNQLLQDKFQAPFIAVNFPFLNVDKSNLTHRSFVAMFPQLPWDKLRETLAEADKFFVDRRTLSGVQFDFVLIGPKIGLTIIEIKSSSYNTNDEFLAGNETLPIDFEDGLSQLASAQTLAYFLREATNNYDKEFCVRKIFFTPNFKKERFDTWILSLTDKQRNHVRTSMGEMAHIFNENMVNAKEDADKPPFYSKLKRILNDDVPPLSFERYEAYAPLIVAMKSVHLALSSDATSSAIGAGDGKPFVDRFLKVVFFNPDQHSVFAGPNRQFIFGAAGTGRSAVLRAKALDLLLSGQSVTVIAPRSSAWLYDLFFRALGLKNYHISTEPNEVSAWGLSEVHPRHLPAGTKLLEFIYDFVEQKLANSFKCLVTDCHIFIDNSDEFHGQSLQQSFINSMIHMAIMQRLCPEKLVWVAIDPCETRRFNLENEERYNDRLPCHTLLDILENWTELESKWKECFFSFSSLRLVMRSSKSLSAIYNSAIDWPLEFCPRLAEERFGERRLENVIIEKDYKNQTEAFDALWFYIKKVLNELSTNHVHFRDVAILFGNQSAKTFIRKKFTQDWPDAPIGYNALTIKSWYPVSSLEWPVVIYASCLPDHSNLHDILNKPYHQYRSLSRARSHFITITLRYELATTVFVGPAKQSFESFDEQSAYFLDKYWENWKNYEQPSSYMIPPIFKYQYPDLSDRAYDATTSKQEQVLNHRQADKAEHAIYVAIQELIQDKFQAPFVAIHSLDLQLNLSNETEQKKLIGPLTKIFLDADWETFQADLNAIKQQNDPNTGNDESTKFLVPSDLAWKESGIANEKTKGNAEYDFVLIGPKVGIVIIEVKGSKFDQPKHFKPGETHLPKGYEEGLKQLKSTDALFKLLTKYYGFSQDSIGPIRKILFAANLEKKRYTRWRETLSEAQNEHVNEKIGEIIQLCQDDAVNEEKYFDKRPLYSALRRVLSQCVPISRELYEKITPVLLATASIHVISSEANLYTVELEETNFLSMKAAENESLCIAAHDPFKHKKGRKLTTGSLLQKTVKMPKVITSIFYLTFDQLTALRGPSWRKTASPGSLRQFILGAAGTGKTIVLQAKALELLAKGESVTIVALRNYARQYKILFDHHKFENYTICDWSINLSVDSSQLSQDLRDVVPKSRLFGIIKDYVIKTLNEPEKLAVDLLGCCSWLPSTDHILIDDAFEEFADETFFPERLFLNFILAMEFARERKSDRVVWVALDPHLCVDILSDDKREFYKQTVNELLRNTTESLHSVTLLTQVMRCSEEVFNVAYDSITQRPENSLLAPLKPLLAHKIQGNFVSEVGNFETYDEAKTVLWNRVKTNIAQFQKQNVDFDNIAVIVVTCSKPCYRSLNIVNFLKDRCQEVWPNIKTGGPFGETYHTHLYAQMSLDNKSNILTVDTSDRVSSFEWSVVLCVACFPKDLPIGETTFASYQKYRAMSRAQSKLINIDLTYNETAASASNYVDRQNEKLVVISSVGGTFTSLTHVDNRPHLPSITINSVDAKEITMGSEERKIGQKLM